MYKQKGVIKSIRHQSTYRVSEDGYSQKDGLEAVAAAAAAKTTTDRQ